MTFLSRLGLLAAAFMFTLGPVMLGEAEAQPSNYQLGLQDAVTPVAERIAAFHNLLLVLITAITVFVMALLLWVMFRFSAKRNPTPSKTTHNVTLELAWTVVPVLILIGIAFPSFRLLYFTDQVQEADITVKAIGRQWYWSFEYPDHGNFTFDSYMVAEEDLQPDQPRLLTADTPLVLPVDTNIRFLVTASDVLHNFAMPQFGLKMDAVPGRNNETWAYVPAEFAGQTFYGQCSELCGAGHAFMPINIKMVSKAEFAEWTKKAREEFAQVDSPEAGAVAAVPDPASGPDSGHVRVAAASAVVPQSE